MSISRFSSPRFLSITICSLALLAACGGGPKFKSTDITGADYGKTLELPDTSGRVRRLADFRGKAVVVFFGFTHCPDVCPTTLADMAGVMKSLGAEAGRVQMLFITVDPERDTPQALEQYVHAFDPRFIALRGDVATTQRVAKDFKIFYEKRKEGDSYTVDHSAQSYVFDPQGRLRLLVRPQGIASDLPEDLRTLLKESS
ncbi:MAG TPA: SCO family protein [Burkholderiales bacterium]|nr:SCO family protein [Burkholderiales bacterium]